MTRTATINSVRKRLEEGKKVTQQMVFDAVSKHAFKQGHRSVKVVKAWEGEKKCAYRGKDNCSCFIGAVMPDSIYRPWMDDANSSAALDICDRAVSIHKRSAKATISGNEAFFGWLRENEGFARNFQDLHDNSYNWSDTMTMTRALHSLAKDYLLNADVLRNLEFSKNRAQ